MRKLFSGLGFVLLAALAGCLVEDTNPTITQNNAVVIPPGETGAETATPEEPASYAPGTSEAALNTVVLPDEAPAAQKPSAETDKAQEATPPALEKTKGEEAAWQNLFDGKSLKNWKKTEFGGEGEVEVKDGQIVLNFGSDMTGITWEGGELPKTNYELLVEAMRVDGTDFFAALTFPCGDSFCSFIPGGWGGGVVGISSIDGFDASENATTTYQSFEPKRWYTLRVRVTPARLQAWIDKEQVVDTDITGRKISVRGDVDLSKPLGISTWNTQGAVKSIKVRKLSAEEIAAAEKSAKADQGK